jgi:hypothetical protein
MSNFDSDGSFENEWNERGELAWNEFDWERYLREQEETTNRYLAFYENNLDHPQRIDEVARNMGWDDGQWDIIDAGTDGPGTSELPEAMMEDYTPDSDVYTLHKNPIFISTKAIYLRARRKWELVAADSRNMPQDIAVNYLTTLHHGEDQSVQAIHALEFGDYAMAISLFKRALSALNRTLALINDTRANQWTSVAAYRKDVLMSLFDLREIWLRVIGECRSELQRPVDDDED